MNHEQEEEEEETPYTPQQLPPVDEDYMREDLNYISSLLEETAVSKKLRENHPGLFSKATVLANYSESDIKIYQLRARQRILRLQLLTPPEKKTVNTTLDYETIETQHSKQLKRAKLGFERRQQVTRVTESTVTRPREEEKKGLFGFFR